MNVLESIPAAWLRRFPEGFRLPLWRWIVLPATTIMAHRSGGIWVSGTLKATEDGLEFGPTKVSAAMNRSAISWSLRWDEIRGVDFRPGMAMDRIDILHDGGSQALQSARSAAFFEKVQAEAIERAGKTPAA